jgi:hypothetical protein
MSKQKRAEYLEKFNNLINEDEEIHKRPRSSSNSSNTHNLICTDDSTASTTLEGILKY